MRIRSSRLVTALAAVVATGFLLTAARAGTVLVDPANMNGWQLFATSSYSNSVGGDGTGNFVTGPGTPPLGVGSAHFNTGTDGTQSVQLRNGDWAGTQLSALTTLSYSTYATQWNGQQVPYLTMYLNNTASGNDRLWFEPSYSSAGAGNGDPTPQANVALNTWQNWNVLTGMVYSDNMAGPGSSAITFAAYLAANPNATMVNDVANSLGGIRIASGFASSTDTFDANVDAFSIGTAAGTTTYNFDPNPPVPEPMSMVLAGLGLSMVAGLRRKGRQA